ncbi:MAG TPA: MBL fold metallo-hydrolase, partial [bacterium]|nr:MBL fold metallo-hydrolase [bacterium]
MKIIQLRLGRFGNISYLIGDETNGQAFVIDPSAEVDAILDAARESGLSIRYVLNTHGHSDH